MCSVPKPIASCRCSVQGAGLFNNCFRLGVSLVASAHSVFVQDPFHIAECVVIKRGLIWNYTNIWPESREHGVTVIITSILGFALVVPIPDGSLMCSCPTCPAWRGSALGNRSTRG